MAMAPIARILGLSLLTSGLGAGLGLALFRGPYSDYIVPTLFLACVGGIIGAVAGAAQEIVTALRHKVPR
jgi:hypothetical protein